MEFESHARALSRKVHLNPVKAGLVQGPGVYTWAGYRYYLDPHGAPPWLDRQTILGEISTRESAARVAYRRFVEASLNTPMENPLQGAVDGWLLGSPRFVERYQGGGQWLDPIAWNEMPCSLASFPSPRYDVNGAIGIDAFALLPRCSCSRDRLGTTA